MLRAAVLSVLLIVPAGCYFEGAVAYHPKISQSVAPTGAPATTADGGGWSAGINIGFYIDVMIPNRTIRGFAVGASPGSFNGYGIKASDSVAHVSTKQLSLRTDLTLPVMPLTTKLQTRAVFVYNWLHDTSVTIAPDTMGAMTRSSSGRSWFLGGALGYRQRVIQGSKVGTFVVTLAAGVEHFKADLTTVDDRAVHVSSTGIGARLLISPAMVGSPPKAPFELAPSPREPVKSNAGCHYAPHPTDPNKSVWKCE